MADNTQVEIFWDLHKNPVPEDINLIEKISQALVHANPNYIVTSLTCYGEEYSSLPAIARFRYSPERYCLCYECENLGRSPYGRMKKIDRERLVNKAETADLLITRDMWAMVRQNVIRKPPRKGNVFLIVTGDPDFKKMMINLKKYNITVMLAQPDKAKIGVEGFYAAWSVSDLVSGKKPTSLENRGF